MSRSRPKILVAFLVVLTAIKVAVILAAGPAAIELDAAQYWRMSTLALSGDVFFTDLPNGYRTPIYPWFLAVMRAIFGAQALKAIVVTQGIFYVASAWIASVIAKRITKLERAQWITLAIYLPATSAITFHATTLSEPLFVFLMMVGSLAVLDYAKYETGGRAAWVAISFALLLLTRPIAILLWVVPLCFILLIHQRRRRRLGRSNPLRRRLHERWHHPLVAAGLVAALVAPWIVRNQLLFDDAFLTKFTGRNIWIVTFQDGSGSALPLPETPAAEELMKRLASVDRVEGWQSTWHSFYALEASGLSDPDGDDLMKTVAVEAIRESPQTFGFQAVRRMINFWRTPITDLPPPDPNDSYSVNQRWSYPNPVAAMAAKYRLGQFLWFNSVLLVAIVVSGIGLIIHFPTRPYAIWIAGILLYFCVVTGMVEIPAYRYRMVVEPMVAVLIGAAISVFANRWIAQRPPQESPSKSLSTTP